MVLRIYLLTVLIVAASLPSYGQQNPTLPSLAQRENLLFFCAGFEDEIGRQATNDNNVLLDRKVSLAAEHLGDELLLTPTLPRPHTPADQIPVLIARGAEAAGKTLWESAALRGGDLAAKRARIVAMRLPDEDKCWKASAEAYTSYHDQAEELRSRLKLSEKARKK